MSRFQFDLATPADDAELRAIISRTPTPGSISVSFAREPSFIESLAVEGEFCQVVVCRDTQRGRLAGFGVRSIKTCYVNDRVVPVGYLSGLRALPEYRSLGLVARGYHFFRELHTDGRTSLYLTTIAEDNLLARRVLTSGRAGLPQYHPAGKFLTLAIPIPRRKRRQKEPVPGLKIESAENRSLEEIFEWINQLGPQRNFFPVYQPADVAEPNGRLRGLVPNDLLVAYSDQDPVGLIGAWNQSDFRQTFVSGYDRRMKWIRPGFNLWQALRGQPGLPAAGQPLRNRPIVMPTMAVPDPERFCKIVRCLVERLAGQDVDCLLLGLHDSDPLAVAIQHLPGILYRTGLYLASWSDGDPLRESLDGRPLYLELGSL